MKTVLMLFLTSLICSTVNAAEVSVSWVAPSERVNGVSLIIKK